MSIPSYYNITRIKCYSSRFGNYIYFNQKPINNFSHIKTVVKKNSNKTDSKNIIVNSKDIEIKIKEPNYFNPFLL